LFGSIKRGCDRIRVFLVRIPLQAASFLLEEAAQLQTEAGHPACETFHVMIRYIVFGGSVI